MSYNHFTENKSSFLIKLKFKIARIMFSNFPYNSIRILGLRMCGFQVGKQVYIGTGLVVTMYNGKSKCHLEIGDRVSIAPRVTLVLQSDPNWSKLNEIIKPLEGKITLGNDCWIGAGTVIMPDITIGEMSIVGSLSVVTKDVEPYTVVAGNPAKIIKTLPKK